MFLFVCGKYMENILVFQIFRDWKKYNHPFCLGFCLYSRRIWRVPLFVGLSASPLVLSCLFHVVCYMYVYIVLVWKCDVCRCFCFGDAKVEIIFGLCKKKDDFLMTFLSTPYIISRVCARVVCFSPLFLCYGIWFCDVLSIYLYCY